MAVPEITEDRKVSGLHVCLTRAMHDKLYMARAVHNKLHVARAECPHDTGCTRQALHGKGYVCA
eukprot:1159632-Pelagomonas_calceolata.AAC.1